MNDSGLEGTPDRLTVGSALARLTPRQRAVLVLRFYEDQTERETARGPGCSVNTVKSQTWHALERLKALAPSWTTRPPGRRPGCGSTWPPRKGRRTRAGL